MSIMFCIMAILVAILLSQAFAFRKFALQVRNKQERSVGYVWFRGAWLLVDILACISIILFLYTFVKAWFFMTGIDKQAYGWLPFIILLYGVYPLNCIGLVLRTIYMIKK